MEQKYDLSGLKNLNPAQCWKYVMADKRKVVPSILVAKDFPELFEVATKNPTVDFIILKYSDNSVYKSNIIYIDKRRYNLSGWYKYLQGVDYVLCDENDSLRFECGLCGVSWLESLDMDKVHTLNSLERIENWESTKNSLDSLLKT